MTGMDICDKWREFAVKCGGTLGAVKVYWTGTSPRHWTLPVGGHQVDPAYQYVWLMRTPNHNRIVFTVIDGVDLNKLAAGTVDAKSVNTDYRQAYLEY